VVTSPPYYGLRDYGTASWEGGDEGCDHKVPDSAKGNYPDSDRKQQTNSGSFGFREWNVCGKCGAIRIDSQIGLEQSHEEYIAKLVSVFREVRRVLKDDGAVWIVIGDSYAGSNNGSNDYREAGSSLSKNDNKYGTHKPGNGGLKPKDLMMIPARVALALQADGWWLRSEIVWCLSGGTHVYARTQKGDMPVMVRDIARLDPKTVRLWNGKKWTQVLGWSRNRRKGDEIEIVLRSGERVSCTPNHEFPTERGLLTAERLQVGDKLVRTKLPEPETVRDCAIDKDAAWLAGLYLAEGSRSDDCIQIAGHKKEVARWERLQHIANKFGGYITRTVDGNNMNIRLYGKILVAIIEELVSGRTAKDKGFANVVWRYSDSFVSEMLEGYLSGDGHWDKNRWRLGFTRNYNLERDIRTACARLGYHLVLNLATVKYKGKDVPIFRGEIRYTRSGHLNEKDPNTIAKINKAKCRYTYDVGVEDEPHLFSLASGILTHNCKPNPMPESVTDRPTKSHEMIYLLTKSAKYFYDYQAILEPANFDGRKDTKFKGSKKYKDSGQTFAERGHERWPLVIGRTERKMEGTLYGGDGSRLHGHSGYYDKDGNPRFNEFIDGTPARNKRDVWTVTTKPFSGKKLMTDYVGDDGKPYTVSPDCPIHSPLLRSQKSDTQQCDGQSNLHEIHNPGTDCCHEQEQSLLSASKNDQNNDVVSDLSNSSENILENISERRTSVHQNEHTSDAQNPDGNFHTQEPRADQDCKTDYWNQVRLEIATSRNIQKSKTDPEQQESLRDITSAQTLFDIQSIEQQPAISDSVVHTSESNTLKDDSDAHPSEYIPYRNADKSSYQELYCTCKIVSIDHFATFPPDLIEPCILAGSREGDTVLDPFSGSGTTLLVSIKHKRNAIGIELNPEYIEMTNKRLSGVQEVLL